MSAEEILWEETPTMEEADNLLAALQQQDADIAALNLRRAAMLEQMDALLKAKTHERNRMAYQIEECLRPFLNAQLEGSDKRSVRLLHGTIGLRKHPGSIKVKEGMTESAVHWAKLNCPSAVRARYDVSVTAIKEAPVDKSKLPPEVFTVTEPGDRFYINTGIKEE